jgi:hypothetical protein
MVRVSGGRSVFGVVSDVNKYFDLIWCEENAEEVKKAQNVKARHD